MATNKLRREDVARDENGRILPMPDAMVRLLPYDLWQEYRFARSPILQIQRERRKNLKAVKAYRRRKKEMHRKKLDIRKPQPGASISLRFPIHMHEAMQKWAAQQERIGIEFKGWAPLIRELIASHIGYDLEKHGGNRPS